MVQDLKILNIYNLKSASKTPVLERVFNWLEDHFF